jgi:hypothetical protein
LRESLIFISSPFGRSIAIGPSEALSFISSLFAGLALMVLPVCVIDRDDSLGCTPSELPDVGLTPKSPLPAEKTVISSDEPELSRLSLAIDFEIIALFPLFGGPTFMFSGLLRLLFLSLLAVIPWLASEKPLIFILSTSEPFTIKLVEGAVVGAFFSFDSPVMLFELMIVTLWMSPDRPNNFIKLYRLRILLRAISIDKA